MSRTIDDLVTEARSRIARWTPWETLEPLATGALLVDIRPQSQRERHGELPVGIVIERNVLEWRLDPASPWRVTRADSHDRVVIVLCQEGYASSLAAASLLDLGYPQAGDVEGGFDAWKTAGLPIRQARQESSAMDDGDRCRSLGAAFSPPSWSSFSGIHRWRGPTRSRSPLPRTFSSR